MSRTPADPNPHESGMGLASFPSQAINIIVGFPVGGPLDIAARSVAPGLASVLGTDVRVHNHPGASGNLATAEVIAAKPDGHTLLLCGPVNAINATLFPEAGFDFVSQTAAVGIIASVPLIIEVHPAVPARSLSELVKLALHEPCRIRVAFAGVGTPQHIAIELFQRRTGVRFTALPYAGSAAALDALLNAEADVMFDPAPSSIAHVEADRLRALATTGRTRSERLHDVPAACEVIPGYEAGSWFGLVAPAGTARSVLRTLNVALNETLLQPQVVTAFRNMVGTVLQFTPDECERFIVLEVERYREIILAADITST